MQASGFFEVQALVAELPLPFVLKAVVELGIPEVIDKSEKPVSFDEIANEIENSNSDVVRRLLKYLAAKKIFDEKPVGFFSHNKLSRCLLKGNPISIAPVVKWLTSGPIISSWQALHSVALDTSPGAEVSAFSKANNAKDMFEYVRRDPGFGKTLIDGLRHGFGPMSLFTMSAVMEKYDGFKTIHGVLIDVGGGDGLCGGKIVQAYPHLKVINYDVPHVLAHARPVPGVQNMAGDMFRSVPAGDAIFLKQVLHNWNDESCKLVLKNCYNALPDKGKMIIVDVFEEGVDLDILMLMLNGGKERNEEEWKTLLSSEGFTDITFISLPTKEGIIEAYKA